LDAEFPAGTRPPPRWPGGEPKRAGRPWPGLRPGPGR